MTVKHGRIIGLILLVVVIAIASLIQSHRLNSHARYTIATTINKYLTIENGEFVNYTYQVNGVIFNGSDTYQACIVPNGRFFVKYNFRNPRINELLQNSPVPDSIKFAPPNGSDKIPGE